MAMDKANDPLAAIGTAAITDGLAAIGTAAITDGLAVAIMDIAAAGDAGRQVPQWPVWR